ncbi:MAG: hypothetical protein IT365_14720 [Candidatus Hydrogenedentes bacterium]|nr:hypothetical protein [Candidatus Hydrogenedentota bacterium]
MLVFAVGFTAATGQQIDYRDVLYGKLPTLSAHVAEADRITGIVRVQGVDLAAPSIPFTFDWGDGVSDDTFFPALHTYMVRDGNYVISVTAHYGHNATDTTLAVVRFVPPKIEQKELPGALRVRIPQTSEGVESRLPGYGIPSSLGGFDDRAFTILSREDIEYILSVAAVIQMDFVNDDVTRVDGSFQQALFRDPSAAGMYSLWYTSPVAFGAGDAAFSGAIGYSSFFHEMGHNFTLNTPAAFCYGGKIDGPANAIYSETLAQLFQHATASELVRRSKEFGIPADLAVEIAASARDSMKLVRDSYEKYLAGNKPFATWNNPATPEDETFPTFMTLTYVFFEHAERSRAGYRTPLKRMMELLQTFDEGLHERYQQTEDTPAAATFRATLMVAAMSHGFGEDLRGRFVGLGFPIDGALFTELSQNVKE